MVQRTLVCVAVVAASLYAAAPAAAQWSITPYVGGVFGGQAHDGARPTVGGAVGRTLTRWLAVEGDVAWTPDLFRIRGVTEPLFADSRVTTVTGNAVLGLPWPSGTTRVHPVGIVGLGVMHTRIGDEDAFQHVSNTHLAVSLGGGMTVDVGTRFGIRGDVRYSRDLQTLDGDSEFFSFGDTHVDFWRATAGFSIRF